MSVSRALDTSGISSREEEKNFQVYIRVRPLSNYERVMEDDSVTMSSPIMKHNLLKELRSARKAAAAAHEESELEMDETRSNAGNTNKRSYQQNIIRIENNLIFVKDLDYKSIDRKEKPFIFNGIFPPLANNEEVFKQSVLPNLDKILEGYNATFFAYGMTGSGKTHTIFGGGELGEKGICFLALNYVLTRTKELRNKSCLLKFSYLEIYNETVRDLLSDVSKSLAVIEDPVRGVVVQELKEIVVERIEEIEHLIMIGNQKRVLASTITNQVSSRSHAIFQLNIEIKDQFSKGAMEELITSRLTFIDLAGSEKGTSVEGKSKGMLEGANINKSLLALGNCINILSDKSKKGLFVPYRDSKLTRLLKDSLGGNTRTVMISCISPSYFCFEETLNTLNYSSRAKNIKQKVSKNLKEVESQYFKYKEIIQNLLQNYDYIQELIRQPTVCDCCGKVGRVWNKDYSFLPPGRSTDKKDWNVSFEALEDLEKRLKEEMESFSQEKSERFAHEAEKLKQGVSEIERQIQEIQQFSQFNLTDKEEYFQRICNDFLANIEENFEIRTSLKELDELIYSNQNQIKLLVEKRQRGLPDDLLEKEIQSLNNNENLEIRKKMQAALEVNQNQREILKELLFKINEDKKIVYLEAEVKKKQLEIQELLFENQKLLHELSFKNRIIGEKDTALMNVTQENSQLKLKILQKENYIKELESALKNYGGNSHESSHDGGRVPKHSQQSKKFCTPKSNTKPKKTSDCYSKSPKCEKNEARYGEILDKSLSNGRVSNNSTAVTQGGSHLSNTISIASSNAMPLGSETSPKERFSQTTPYTNTSYTEKCKSPQRLFGIGRNPSKPEAVTKSNNSAYFKKSPKNNSPSPGPAVHAQSQSTNLKKMSPANRENSLSTSPQIKPIQQGQHYILQHVSQHQPVVHQPVLVPIAQQQHLQATVAGAALNSVAKKEPVITTIELFKNENPSPKEVFYKKSRSISSSRRYEANQERSSGDRGEAKTVAGGRFTMNNCRRNETNDAEEYYFPEKLQRQYLINSIKGADEMPGNEAPLREIQGATSEEETLAKENPMLDTQSENGDSIRSFKNPLIERSLNNDDDLHSRISVNITKNSMEDFSAFSKELYQQENQQRAGNRQIGLPLQASPQIKLNPNQAAAQELDRFLSSIEYSKENFPPGMFYNSNQFPMLGSSYNNLGSSIPKLPGNQAASRMPRSSEKIQKNSLIHIQDFGKISFSNEFKGVSNSQHHASSKAGNYNSSLRGSDNYCLLGSNTFTNKEMNTSLSNRESLNRTGNLNKAVLNISCLPLDEDCMMELTSQKSSAKKEVGMILGSERYSSKKNPVMSDDESDCGYLEQPMIGSPEIYKTSKNFYSASHLKKYNKYNHSSLEFAD